MRDPLSARIVDEEGPLTLGQICRIFDLHADHVIEMVEVGIVMPETGQQPSEWRFPAGSLVRIHRTLRLRRDLSVDLTGAALALDLLEEIRRLRARVRALETGREY